MNKIIRASLIILLSMAIAGLVLVALIPPKKEDTASTVSNATMLDNEINASDIVKHEIIEESRLKVVSIEENIVKEINGDTTKEYLVTFSTERCVKVEYKTKNYTAEEFKSSIGEADIIKTKSIVYTQI